MKLLILAITIFLSITTLAQNGVCASQVIEQDGYYVSLKWRTTGNKLKVDGFIRDGKTCKKMSLSMHMVNNKDNSAAIMQRSLHYHTTSGLKFRMEDDCYTSGMVSHNNKWRVTSFNIACQN